MHTGDVCGCTRFAVHCASGRLAYNRIFSTPPAFVRPDSQSEQGARKGARRTLGRSASEVKIVFKIVCPTPTRSDGSHERTRFGLVLCTRTPILLPTFGHRRNYTTTLRSQDLCSYPLVWFRVVDTQRARDSAGGGESEGVGRCTQVMGAGGWMRRGRRRGRMNVGVDASRGSAQLPLLAFSF